MSELPSRENIENDLRTLSDTEKHAWVRLRLTQLIDALDRLTWLREALKRSFPAVGDDVQAPGAFLWTDAEIDAIERGES